MAPTHYFEARAVIEAVHDGCFIANSVACAVRTEPELVVGST